MSGDQLEHRPRTYGATNKLSAIDVLVIRDRLSNGERQKVLAWDYRVHINTINKINTGRRWAWLD